MINRIKTYISKREFAKNVLTLMTGTTIAQAIPVAISPILTRIYTPDDFGVLALFLAITAITGTIVNAKYEQAIILPKKDEDAVNLLVLSILISIGISILLLLIIVFLDDKIVLWLDAPKIKYWLYFIPVSTLFIGIFNSLNYFNIRKKEYKNISISQVTKSGSLSVFQIGLGLLKNGPAGLIIGQIISYFSGNFILLKVLKNKPQLKKSVSKLKMMSLSKEYKKFPIYSLPSILLNSVNLNMVNFFVSSIFSVTTLGFYSLTQRIIGIPSRVIVNSFSQVYFQKATEEFHQTGKTERIFKKTLKKIFYISLPVFTLMFFVVKPLFSFVFGAEWEISGVYAQILIPLALVRFISGALSLTMIIHQKQQYSLFMNILLFITTLSIFFIGKYLNAGFINFLIYFSTLLSFEYLLFLYIYFLTSKSKLNNA